MISSRILYWRQPVRAKLHWRPTLGHPGSSRVSVPPRRLWIVFIFVPSSLISINPRRLPKSTFTLQCACTPRSGSRLRLDSADPLQRTTFTILPVFLLVPDNLERHHPKVRAIAYASLLAHALKLLLYTIIVPQHRNPYFQTLEFQAASKRRPQD